jgi:hypothetical protein
MTAGDSNAAALGNEFVEWVKTCIVQLSSDYFGESGRGPDAAAAIKRVVVATLAIARQRQGGKSADAVG